MIEFIFAFAIGWVIGHITAIRQVSKLLTKANDSSTEENKAFVLYVEKHGDILYLYEGKNNTFICQGKTVEELKENALKYKNITLTTLDDYNKLINEGENKVS